MRHHHTSSAIVAVAIGTALLAACTSGPTATPATVTTITPADSTLATTTPAMTAPADGTRYLDEVFDELDSATDVVYATAPSLTAGTPEQLLLDWYAPANDTQAARPVIVWVHGGGFRGGHRDDLTEMATAYAHRGYLTLTIDYQLDPGSRCQDLQDGRVDSAAERLRCRDAILAAQHDTQAAIRWVRANAASLGADPDRVAVAGTSAGAVTAVNVAQRADDPGDVGDHLDQPSAVRVALAASGCNYFPESIGAGDPPMSLLASELDQAVPFSCVQDTAQRSQAVGVEVQTLFYLGERTHARALYLRHRAEVDAAWTAFLVEHLDL